MSNPIGWLILGPGPKALGMFFGQLGRMSSAGLSPVQVLTAIERAGPGARLAKAANRMTEVIQSGGSYAEAMRAVPGTFSALQVSIIAAAERGGNVDAGFAMLAKNLEIRSRQQQKLIGALIYPILLLHLAILLPPIVQLVIKGPGAYMRAVLPGFAVLYGGAAVLFVLFKLMGGPLRAAADALVLVVPMLGTAVRRLALARFTRACRCLYEAGVSIINAVKEAAAASGNRYIQKRLLKAARLLQDGSTVAEAFRAARVYKFDAQALLDTGEQSGNLSEALDKIAENLEFDAELAVNRMHKILPVVVFLGVAGYIGYLYITTILSALDGVLEVR